MEPNPQYFKSIFAADVIEGGFIAESGLFGKQVVPASAIKIDKGIYRNRNNRNKYFVTRESQFFNLDIILQFTMENIVCHEADLYAHYKNLQTVFLKRVESLRNKK